MIVTIVLTTAGSSTGPFNLYSDVDGYTTPFELGVAKSSLLAGYTSSAVPDGTTNIRITTGSPCNSYLDIVVGTTTTTSTSTSTSTTTTTTTAAPECAEFLLEGGESGRTFNFTDCDGLEQTVVVPAGDSNNYCIQLPFFAGGATNVGACVLSGCAQWSVTYSPSEVVDLYARWFDCQDQIVTEMLVSSLISTDNGDGTYTGFVCNDPSGTMPYPEFVLDGVVIAPPSGISWTLEGPCLA